MTTRSLAVLATCMLAAAAAALVASRTQPASASAQQPAETYKIVTVVKALGIGWFDRMSDGVKRFAEQTGNDATLTGADNASPEAQIKVIRDTIATHPDAITVVPNSPHSLEGVLRQAMNAGIKVVTHEASSQVNTNVDIEGFNNADYGAHMMDKLAKCMGGKGQYVAFVGHLTAESHMQWVAGALAEAKKKFPGITRIGGPVESLEDENVSYQKTKALLAKYPNIKGFEGSGSTDIPGIARAIREEGLQNKTCVMGTSIPSISGKYLKDGSVDAMFFWDPALAGIAQDKLAVMLLEGQKIGRGLNLHIHGYTHLQKITGSPHGLAGNAWVDVTNANVAKYPF